MRLLREPPVTEETLAAIIRKTDRLLRLGLIPAAMLSTVMYSQELFATTHSRHASMFVERSIEILAPYVDEHSRLDLRARFRSIESAAEFYDLEDRLRALASQHSVKLPEFKSVR